MDFTEFVEQVYGKKDDPDRVGYNGISKELPMSIIGKTGAGRINYGKMVNCVEIMLYPYEPEQNNLDKQSGLKVLKSLSLGEEGKIRYYPNNIRRARNLKAISFNHDELVAYGYNKTRITEYPSVYSSRNKRVYSVDCIKDAVSRYGSKSVIASIDNIKNKRTLSEELLKWSEPSEFNEDSIILSESSATKIMFGNVQYPQPILNKANVIYEQDNTVRSSSRGLSSAYRVFDEYLADSDPDPIIFGYCTPLIIDETPSCMRKYALNSINIPQYGKGIQRGEFITKISPPRGCSLMSFYMPYFTWKNIEQLKDDIRIYKSFDRLYVTRMNMERISSRIIADPVKWDIVIHNALLSYLDGGMYYIQHTMYKMLYRNPTLNYSDTLTIQPRKLEYFKALEKAGFKDINYDYIKDEEDIFTIFNEASDKIKEARDFIENWNNGIVSYNDADIKMSDTFGYKYN